MTAGNNLKGHGHIHKKNCDTLSALLGVALLSAGSVITWSLFSFIYYFLLRLWNPNGHIRITHEKMKK